MADGTVDPRQLMQNGAGSSSASAAGLRANGLPPETRAQSRLRVPTVTEALPFSPFSSIVPFNADIMHPPLALSTTSSTAFDNDEAVKSTRRELERLTAGATSAEQASKRCKATLSDIERFLVADNIGQYKFKSMKRVRPREDSDKPPPQPALSSFAKMIYENVKEPHRYLTPPEEPQLVESKNAILLGQAQQPRESPAQASHAARPALQQTPKTVQRPQKASPAQQPHPPNQKQQPTPAQQLSRPVQQLQKSSPARPQQPSHQPRGTPIALVPVIQRPSQQVQAQYTPQHDQQRVQQQNLNIPVSKQISSQDLQATPGGSQKSKLYVQPLALSPSQRAAFQKVNDVLPASTPSHNRSAYLTNNAIAVNSDQKRKAEQALETLNNQLEAIFEAEDQMQPDTSEAAPVRETHFFKTHDTEDGPALVLQAEAQVLLNTAFQKVVNHNLLDSIEVDQLQRIQRICERSVSTLGSGSLSIGEDWSTDDAYEWVARLEYAENGIIAARTLLHIMTGGSHRKELQSEDCLRLVLDALRTGLDTCIVPIVELRSYIGEKAKDAPSNPKFTIAAENRNALQAFVAATTKTLSLLGDLFAKTDVDETGVSSLVYTCKMLIFAENATNERDSALGIQIFEAMRKVAMNVTNKIFTKYSDQRRFIVDEILLSLERLPASKQSARQYRLNDGKPIQLVSALLMRLVQSSAVVSKKSASQLEDSDGSDEDEESSESEEYEQSDDDMGARKKKKGRKPVSSNRATDLTAVYQPLQQECSTTAAHIANMLLERAIGKSKSDTDDPFRRLLDVFTEDFINVLGSSDWPAAELLLRRIVAKLLPLADDPKRPAPARTLALELLGTIGSGILDTLKATTDSSKMTDDDDHVSQGLAAIGSQAETGDLDPLVVTSFEGPYRVLLEYLHARNVEKDPQLLSARGYHLVQWAELVLNMNKGKEQEQQTSTTALQNKIRSMMVDINWLEDHSQFQQPTTSQGKLAARIVTASSALCRAFPRMLHSIIQSMTSQQPTVRSRALKSVTTLLEKDPEILDRNEAVLRQILRSLADASALVRDSALNLIQQCVALRPALELKVYAKVVERTTDASVPVRKRAMAFLKQVYLHTHENKVRAKISNAIISRIHDIDENVAEVARATIEDIWFSAFRKVRGEDRSVDAKVELAGQVALIIQTVELGDEVAAVLEALLKTLMTVSKQADDNRRISKAFVGILFDGLLDTSEIPGTPSQASILRTATVFAKTAPGLFTASQIELLGPYTRNMMTSDELEVFHFVVTILRYTMPGLTGLKSEFLQDLYTDLLKSSQSVQSELPVVAPCLWTIDSMLGNRARLVNFLISVLAGVHSMQNLALNDDPKAAFKAVRLLRIIGQFGKACQLDANLKTFKGSPHLSWYKGDSTAGLMVEICCKYTSPKQPITVREAALEAVCAICYTYPKNYLRSDVVNAIQMIFDAREPALERALLFSLEPFFQSGEQTPEDPTAPELGSGVESGAQRLGNTYQAAGADVALNSLCQRFLSHFLRIALTSLEEVALCAARTVASINRQGLMNPTDSAPGLVALMTCSVPAIAKIAFLSYKTQFYKWGGTLDKTMLKSVHLSYDYQRDVAKNITGFTGQPPTSKLHYFWEVLRKDGFAKNRTKFFDQVCGSLMFDPAKMTAIEKLKQHLLYVRYCAENIAFLDHDKVTEPLQVVSCLEKAYAGAGLAVTQGIETDIFKLQVPVSSQAPATSEALPNGDSDTIVVAQSAQMSAASVDADGVDADRLLQLATSAQILSLLVETRNFLRNLWQLKKYGDSGNKSKAKSAKDAEKNATRATNAPALIEAFQSRIATIMSATEDEASQRKICSSFVELMTVDNEAKVASGDEDDITMEDDDDARSEGSHSKSPAPRGKKRKSTDGQGGPPKKKGRPRKSSIAKMDDEEGGWD